MTRNIRLALIGLLFLAFSAQAQNVNVPISSLPVPPTGSANLSTGDKVPATRAGVTYGLTAGWGGTCATNTWVSTVSPQGVPSCTQPNFTNINGFLSPNQIGGTYLNGHILIGNSSTGFLQNGTILAGSNISIMNSAGSITISGNSSAFVDPTAAPYNAVCDGVTDTTAGFNAAIATGKSVLMPYSPVGNECRVCDLYIQATGTSIIGGGGLSYSTPLSNYNFKATAGCASDIIGANESADILLSGFSIIGNSSTDCISGGSSYSTFQNLYLTQCRNGIGDSINYTHTAKIMNVTAYGNVTGFRNLIDSDIEGGDIAANTANGIYLGAGANDNTIRPAKIEFNQSNGIECQDCNHNNFIPGVVDRNYRNGILLYQDGGGTADGNTIGPSIFRRNGRDGTSGEESHIRIAGPATNISITGLVTISGGDDGTGNLPSPLYGIDFASNGSGSPSYITISATDLTGVIGSGNAPINYGTTPTNFSMRGVLPLDDTAYSGPTYNISATGTGPAIGMGSATSGHLSFFTNSGTKQLDIDASGTMVASGALQSVGAFSVNSFKLKVNSSTAVTSIDGNTSLLPSPQSDSILQIGNANSSNTRLELDSFAAPAFVSTIRFDGSASSPTAVQSGDQIGGYNAWAYNGAAAIGPLATFRAYAAQTQSSGNGGTYAEIGVTPIATTTMAAVVRFENDGGITVPPTVTGGSKGAGSINASSLFLAGSGVDGATPYQSGFVYLAAAGDVGFTTVNATSYGTSGTLIVVRGRAFTPFSAKGLSIRTSTASAGVGAQAIACLYTNDGGGGVGSLIGSIIHTNIVSITNGTSQNVTLNFDTVASVPAGDYYAGVLITAATTMPNLAVLNSASTGTARRSGADSVTDFWNTAMRFAYTATGFTSSSDCPAGNTITSQYTSSANVPAVGVIAN